MDALMAAPANTTPPRCSFADHGEALGEHGNFGHEQTLYEENLRVPLFVHNAGETETVDEQLLAIAAGTTRRSDAQQPQSRSIRTPRQFVVSHTEENQTRSVRTSRWKLVRDPATGVPVRPPGRPPKEATDVVSRTRK